MKHIRKFTESKEESTFKNTDEDIRYFFTDYTDEDPNSLQIKNGLIYDGRFIEDTSYMKDPSKFRRAKLITLKVGKPNGLQIRISKCMTDLEMLSNALLDIQRFYDLSDEDVNYTITTDHTGLIVEFITLGDMIKPEESQSSKIDGYLKRISDSIRKMGHKNQTIKGNWLDIKFPKRGGGPLGFRYGIANKLNKIGNAEINLNNVTSDFEEELVNIRNEAWEDGLKFNLSGGDEQLVVKLSKR